MLPPKSWEMQHINHSGSRFRQRFERISLVTGFRFREYHRLHPVKHPIPNKLLLGKPPPVSLQASATVELRYTSPRLRL